ncbi:MAG: hypothetical protein LQ338_005100 [Usnochroma carphineum]|nr:MAG: hypothetical protein LQ338_005100 [Usnochroma carphineum]
MVDLVRRAIYYVSRFCIVSSTPAQPTLRKTGDIGNALSDLVFPNPGRLLWRPEPSREANSTHPNASSTNTANGLGYTTVIWRIADTSLSLKANIGPWQLSPARILATLGAANSAVGKKVASQLLEKKFTQQEGSRINTMIFEISPGYGDKVLTWGHVAIVLSDNGLPKFFREYNVWTSTYFEVVDERRGVLGDGAVRKWYQIVPPHHENGIATER